MEFDFQKLANATGATELVYGELSPEFDPTDLPPSLAEIVVEDPKYDCVLDLVATAKSVGCEIECVEQYGGMDKGSDIWAIYKVTYPDGKERWWKCHGYYASHYGADYHGCMEVKAKSVQRVEYVPIGEMS